MGMKERIITELARLKEKLPELQRRAKMEWGWTRYTQCPKWNQCKSSIGDLEILLELWEEYQE